MTQTLARRLRLPDAVAIGLGSMIGAGVFSAFAPATRSAGSLLLVALAVAGVVAFANATSSAQLAAQYPASGGAYLSGRERLGEWPGFLAGWSFVIGKTASCAAMALTVAAYAVPVPWQRPLAVAAVVALTAVNLFGITRTALLTRILVAAVLLVLVAAVILAFLAPAAPAAAGGSTGAAPAAPGLVGVLQGAGLLFFAFAGYARIATLGEEVVDPVRTIPRAVVIALAVVLVVYLLVGLALLHALGPDGIAGSSAPLADAVRGTVPGAETVVAVGAALAALGALLALVTGVSRTTLAMARNRDLPSPLARVGGTHTVPWVAELAIAAAVIVLVLTTDLRGAIGFSSFGVLLYYLVANAAALTQPPAHRRWPRGLAAVGVVGCLVLAATLPVGSVVGGLIVLGVGVLARGVVLAVRKR